MKRPFPVTLSIVLVLFLTSWNALRAWTSIAWQETLSEFAVQMLPIFSAGIGFLWFAIGTALFIGTWQKKAWSAKLLRGVAAGYTIWYWSERFLWQNPRANIPFTLVINLACLMIIYLASKSLLREAYERNIENPETE